MWHLLSAHFGALMLAALMPFVFSHLVVLQARHMGMPYRLGLDIAHGLFVLSYLTVVMRMHFSGAAKFGFAVPRPRWPGFEAVVLAGVSVLLIGFPAALILHPITQTLEALADDQGGLWSYVPTVMMPEFIMTTLIGLALAAAMRKVAP
jgi:hypothetical protein